MCQTKKMANASNDIGNLSRQDVTDDVLEGIAQAVEFSFQKRPMVRITESEVKRRVDIAFETWKLLVEEGEYVPQRALIAVPTVLIEAIDRETRSIVPALIDTEFETKILPHNMSKRIQSDRALSALARLHDTVDITTLPEGED